MIKMFKKPGGSKTGETSVFTPPKLENQENPPAATVNAPRNPPLPDTFAHQREFRFSADDMKIIDRMLLDPTQVYQPWPFKPTYMDIYEKIMSGELNFNDDDQVKRHEIPSLDLDQLNEHMNVICGFENDMPDTELRDTWQHRLNAIRIEIASGADLTHIAKHNQRHVLAQAARSSFTDALGIFVLEGVSHPTNPAVRFRFNPFWPDANGTRVIHNLARNALKAADGNVAAIKECLRVASDDLGLVQRFEGRLTRKQLERELLQLRDGNYGYTVMHWACAEKNLPLLKWLVEEYQLQPHTLSNHRNLTNVVAATPLSDAFLYHSFDCLAYLLIEKGYNIAEPEPGQSATLVPFLKGKLATTRNGLVNTLLSLRGHSRELFNTVIHQCVNSSNADVRSRFSDVRALCELFDKTDNRFQGDLAQAFRAATAPAPK